MPGEIRSIRIKPKIFQIFGWRHLSLATPQGRLVLLILSALTLGLVYDPDWPLPDLCLWDRLFGYCPARRTTRALHLFLNGDFQGALLQNRNVLAIIPVALAIGLRDIRSLFQSR
jgi:hypothetical protein